MSLLKRLHIPAALVSAVIVALLTTILVAGLTGAQRASAQVATAPTSAHSGSADVFPAWAYPWDPDYKMPPDDGIPRHVPGSSASYTVTQERDLFIAPDWHPDSHPPMPDIVSKGRKPDTRACGSCHRPEGTGGPENSSLAGLPVSYIVQQMTDFKTGARKYAVPQRSSMNLMKAVANGVTDEEVALAAAYFASLKPQGNLSVIETETVPRTRIARVFVALAPDGGTEPIGERIVEVPADTERFEHRDDRVQFIIYTPPQSGAKGENLVRTGRMGTTQQCAACHGADLKGTTSVPGVAGRSPSYIVRQLYDFKSGARAGPGSPPMKAVVQKLSHQDMIAIAAYLASLPP